jgi:putative Mg2+ transporter-C (MgtC) family protein
MIQVSLLLPLAGKNPTSFVTLDLMRLPLGILSGMGFIGGGAILRRNNFVVGVTTAATLWFVTVIGLCFGGGQVLLGIVGSAIGLGVLTGLRRVEDNMKQDRQGIVSIMSLDSGPTEEDVRASLLAAGFAITSCSAEFNSGRRTQQLNCEVRRKATAHESSNVPEAVRLLAQRSGVISVAWTPQLNSPGLR